MARPYELPLVLPDRPTDGILHDRLARAVEEFNASTDPVDRVELHEEIVRLRRLLTPLKGAVRHG